MTGLFLTHWFQYFYVPGHGPWYEGNVWGNVFVVAVVAPLAWLWSKSKFWPLRPLARIASHVRHSAMLTEELHHLHHHGSPHPRAVARAAATGSSTPAHPDFEETT